MSSSKNGLFSHLKSDLPASLVVFLVALPLCLGIALASGAPLFSGLIAGVVGGIIVGALSGSPLGVSGPAAGLAVIVLDAITDIGSFPIFLSVVVLAGVFQFILGVIRAGVIGYYFPNSVIKGMLAGIGVLIAMKQIPHALGYDKDPEGDFAYQQVDGHNTFTEFTYALENISMGPLIIALLSLGILILWETKWMKKFSWATVIQGPLVVVVLGIILGSYFGGIDTLALSSDQLVNIDIATSMEGMKSLLTFPDFSRIFEGDMILLAVTIAVVASLETLLCVEATDKLDPHKRVTPTNRELRAQGVGNVVSGLIGGLPVTQVIVRSSANIQSGGKSKLSAIAHGFLLMICVLTIPHILNMIPYASLAAILLMVGYKLAKPSLFRDMIKMGRSQYVPFLVTVIAIVRTDLLMGIGLGLVAAVIEILWNNYRVPYWFHQDEHEEGGPVRLQFSENLSFLNKASILRTLNDIPEGSKVILDGSKNRSMHPDIIEIIEDFKDTAAEKGIDVDLVSMEILEDHDPVKHFDEKVLKRPKKNGILSKLKKK